MTQTTTIRVSQSTREELKQEKDYKNETYDEIIKELLIEREQRLKEKIDRAREEEESYTHEEIKERHGLA